MASRWWAPCKAGSPPSGCPQGITWSDVAEVLGIAFSCFVLIIAQSAATSRSFAAKHGQRVDMNRDILGLAGANFAAGLSGTFVVNGSPTKTQILDDQKGRTQLANLTMSVVVLVFVLFFTGLLTNMPKAVLAGIVFMIGVEPDRLWRGCKGIRGRRVQRVRDRVRHRLRGLRRRRGAGHHPGDRPVDPRDHPPRVPTPRLRRRRARRRRRRTYSPATPGAQSLPGLVVFRFDAELFYANASRFTDDIEAVIQSAPDKVRWLLLDCSSIDDVDYSAGIALGSLVDYVHGQGAQFGIVAADDHLLETLKTYGVLDRFGADHVFASLEEAFEAFRATPTAAS